MSMRKLNEDIASEPYIARGDDTSGYRKLCSDCLKKGCNISLWKACLKPLIDKWYKWKTFGIPADPSWDLKIKEDFNVE